MFPLVKRHWMVKAAVKYRNEKGKELGQVLYQKMCGKDGCNFGEVMSVLRSLKLMRRIVVAAMKLLLRFTRVALSQLENIARNLLLKKVKIQHQVSYICTFIHMVMMENHLLVSILELFMLLKKVEIQHQVSYICTFIHMVMMKNHLLMSILELSMYMD